MSRSVALGDDLDRWLIPFLAVMGRSTRRRWGPLTDGLLGPDGPKAYSRLPSVSASAATINSPLHQQFELGRRAVMACARGTR